MPETHLATLIERAIDGWNRFYFDAFTALKVNGISGDYVEFGSMSGTSMAIAHQQIELTGSRRHMWAFDSFAGLPESDDPNDQHPSYTAGIGGGGVQGFHDALARYGVPTDAYTTIEGFYEETLPPLGPDGPPTDIALAYIDCNLYSSTVTVMEFLRPRLKHGMIIGMDDWFCWSPTEVSGERVVLHEFELANPQWRFHRFKEISWSGMSFVVERSDALSRGTRA